MKMQLSTVFASIGLLLILASLGCGSGSVTPQPTAAVAATANPLVAQYNISHFDSGLSAWVEFGTDTNYGRQTSVVTSSSSGLAIQKLNVLVAGMKQQTTYHMRAHAAWPGGSWVDEDQTFKTGAIPSSSLLPQFTVTQPTVNPGASAGGVELLSMISSLGTYLSAVATDLQGNVIWYCPGGATPVKPMTNGHYLMNSGTDWIEVDLACNTIRDVSIGQISQSLQATGHAFGPLNAFHHDMLVLPNGHWILLGNVYKEFTDLPGYPGTMNVLGDVLMDVDLSGNVVWAWSAFDHLDVTRHLQGLPDWTHSNALQYTADGNLLLSIRHQSWIIKIDYANGAGQGDVIWRLGDGGMDYGPGFTLLGGDATQWFYAEHYPNILSVDGSQTTLAIFDNGNLRLDSSGGDPCGATTTSPACYTRATIFQIDESTMLASVLWQYLPGYYSNWGGSIGVLSNNDVEFNMSNPFNQAASQIEEVTQTDSPQVVWQMKISGEASYRGYRIPSLYPGVTWK